MAKGEAGGKPRPRKREGAGARPRRPAPRYRDLVELAHDLIWEVDAEGRWTYLNRNATRAIYGYEPEEMIGRPFTDFETPEQARRDLEVFAAIKEGTPSFSYETVHLRRDGRPVALSFNAVVRRGRDGEILGTSGTAVDITARRESEEALRRSGERLEELVQARTAELQASEERFRRIVDASPMGIHMYRLDAGGRLVFTGANQAADLLLGVDHRQFVGRTLEEAFPGAVETEVPMRYRRACTHGERWSAEQLDYADDRIRGAFEVHAFPTSPGAMAALFLDITERKRAEVAVRQSEERYRLVVENAGDGICIAQDGRVLFPNRRIAELLGVPREEIEGREFLEFIAPEDRALVQDRHLRRMQGENTPTTYELRLLRRDGEKIWTSLNTVLITWEGRPASLNFIRDITEQRRLEEQVLLYQRLESLGTLAGGIAHDFNNILMGIQGNASLLLLALAEGEPLRERVRNIERCVESGAALTRQLLGFARGGRYDPAPTDLNSLILDAVLMFGRTRKEISLHTQLAEHLLPVEAERGQLQQVLLNLFVNAGQAMPTGGDLFVETANIQLEGEDAEEAKLPPGRYVLVSIRDTGCGMDEAVRERVFDPFFTTRERERGTGLGLASVFGIVRHHGGAIAVESSRGEGTTFTILLPATERPLAPPPPEASGVPRGSGTVLIVDDESAVRRIGRDLLAHLGYEVIEAADGEAAVATLRAREGKVDAVLLDMVMPGMSGAETFDRIREVAPGARVLLCSGYSLESRAREIMARGCDGFLQKPYTLKVLAQKLDALLAGR